MSMLVSSLYLYCLQDMTVLCTGTFIVHYILEQSIYCVNFIFIFREIHLCHQNAANMSGVEIVLQMSLANQENDVKLMTKYAVCSCYFLFVE